MDMESVSNKMEVENGLISGIKSTVVISLLEGCVDPNNSSNKDGIEEETAGVGNLLSITLCFKLASVSSLSFP